MHIKILFLVLACSLLAACAKTTVVLIPDPAGKVGQVALTTTGGTTLLSHLNESAQATKAEAAPTPALVLSETEIKARFAKTLAQEPRPPLRYRLYFATGTSDMTAEAKAEISSISAAIQTAKSCDLSVIGHSDRVGNDETNKDISLQRADKVAKALMNRGVESRCMDVRYYGENDPAVATADNVAEPLNRRVEVEVR